MGALNKASPIENAPPTANIRWKRDQGGKRGLGIGVLAIIQWVKKKKENPRAKTMAASGMARGGCTWGAPMGHGNKVACA